jgi:hypothetical protein
MGESRQKTDEVSENAGKKNEQFVGVDRTPAEIKSSMIAEIIFKQSARKTRNLLYCYNTLTVVVSYRSLTRLLTARIAFHCKKGRIQENIPGI